MSEMRWGLLLALGLLGVAAAQDGPAHGAAQRPPHLVVGVVDSPPLAIHQPDGSWSGLAVELWGRIASHLGVQYELRPLALEAVDQALTERHVDLAIGAISVTPQGAMQHDFTQPFLATGLGFAQRRDSALHWEAVWQMLRSSRLLVLIGAIVIGVLLVGTIIALLERRHHSTDFGGRLRDGVSTGVWWAAVTMTTVGYGDATPKTTLGRGLALLWMFVGVVAVAILTATVTSLLTLSHLRGSVQRPSDLLHLRLGAVAGGASADYLEDRHAPFVAYDSYAAGLTALQAGEVEAFVANLPALRYLTRSEWHGVLEPSPIVLQAVLYAIALPDRSPWRDRIDDALIAVIHQDEWRDVQRRYLGAEYH